MTTRLTDQSPLHFAIGQALHDALTDDTAAPQPDWFDAREIDRLVDAVMPVLAGFKFKITVTGDLEVIPIDRPRWWRRLLPGKAKP